MRIGSCLEKMLNLELKIGCPMHPTLCLSHTLPGTLNSAFQGNLWTDISSAPETSQDLTLTLAKDHSLWEPNSQVWDRTFMGPLTDAGLFSMDVETSTCDMQYRDGAAQGGS